MSRYTRLASACVGLLLSSTLFAAKDDRQTTDHQPLPEPEIPLRIEAKLQLIGNRLGALPEEASRQLWEIRADLERVKTARRQAADYGLDLKEYDYLAGGLAGSTQTFIDIDKGRVRRLLLIFPGMSLALAQNRMAKLATDAEERPTQIGDDACVFSREGVQYFARAVGQWSKTRGAERNVGGVQPARQTGGPAAIEVGVDRLDWMVVHDATNKDTLTAMREGRLIPGMKMSEAFYAMRQYKLTRRRLSAGGEVWTWSKEKRQIKEYDVVVTDYGVVTTGRVQIKDAVIMTARFGKDGLLVESGQPDTIEDGD